MTKYGHKETLTKEEFRLTLEAFEKAKDTVIALQDKNIDAYNRIETVQAQTLQQLSENEFRITNLESSLWNLRRDLNTCLARFSEKQQAPISVPPPSTSVAISSVWVYIIVPTLVSIIILLSALLLYYKIF
jgi:hypothetical protein